MTGCVYRLYILCTFLSGVHLSWIVHKHPLSWKLAAKSCVSDNQILLNNIDEHLTQHLNSCMNKEDLTFWTGGYTDYGITDWIKFIGCFNDSRQRVSTLTESQLHTVSSCHSFCGRDIFGLTIDSCLCFKNNTLMQQSALQRSYNCIQSGEDYIGINGSIAIYKYAADTMGPPGSWCSTYRCSGANHYTTRDCYSTAHYACENGFSLTKMATWEGAIRACWSSGSFLSLTIPCNSFSNVQYWSNVRRFREHKYVSKGTTWGLNIKECEMIHTKRGSITLERTTDCLAKQLPYVCQSDDGNNVIYNESVSEQCKSQNVTEKVTYTPPGRLSSSFSGGPRERTTSMNPETTRTPNRKNESTSYTRSHLASEGMNRDQTNSHIAKIVTTQSSVPIDEKSSTQDRSSLRHPETGVAQSGRTTQTTQHTILDTSTHAIHNMMASKKESRVGLIAGVVAGCVVAVVAVVVILVFCRKASRKKNDNAENKNVPPASNPAYDSWLYANTSTNSAKEREVTVDENNSICDIELYDVSGGDYDHLRSNNRRIKKEVDYMYDTTAQVKAEEEMYSSTRKGNSYVESSDFYDSMQRIKNEGEDLYDHSMTASNYSQTSLYSMAQHCSDPTEF